jgi:glucose-6-phosphate 1-dehydrogenase
MAEAGSEVRRPDPCVLVIFGASGDLTSRKLLPGLWNLHCEGQLPEGFAVIGVARTPMTDAEFRQRAEEGIRQFSRFPDRSDEEVKKFTDYLFYLSGEYDQAKTYQELRKQLEKACDLLGACGNHLYYLATPPRGYEEIARQLGKAKLSRDGELGGWSRIIVEKPFGSDLASARQLNTTLREVFQEHQIYRIDHYLGKETVQNLLVFRFGNGIFEPIWNRRYIDHVQISAAEEIGVEGRGSYYESAGALRDMIQNHLMQVLCHVAMEGPTRFEDRAVRNEKSKVLEAIRPIAEDEVSEWTARGQYAPGEVGVKLVPGYLQEEGVSPHSHTETYAAVKFMIDNWRWAGVPFYLRSGKRLPHRVTEISIHFKQAPLLLFRRAQQGQPQPNVLNIRIQPNEGIDLCFGVKVPGSGMVVRQVDMKFDYDEEFKTSGPEAYERLLLDCMLGDITLFSRDDWMDLSWQLIDPILKAWAQDTEPLPQYVAGTWGPREADDLLARDGRKWRAPRP